MKSSDIKINGCKVHLTAIDDGSMFKLHWRGCSCCYGLINGKWHNLGWSCPNLTLDAKFAKLADSYLQTL